MLAGRKRKCKCTTGKVLTESAARPNARWTERGNREEGVSVNKGLVSFFDVESVGPDIALESI